MINTKGMSPEKIRMVGVEILNRELGADVTIEFLQQYSRGHGDYTKEREKLLEGETIDSLSKELFKLQESGKI
ncbi:MAG: hypothetical protein JW874_00335 [Spirochaetales bacterium]|nr:hypothetical protein [Spirochaetales bacterium]